MGFSNIGSDGRPLDKPALAALLDEKTGLMWAAKDVSDKSMTFSEAVTACSEFRCAGFSDWRLPTIDELETLRDRSRYDPAADPALGLKSSSYWSSTTAASSPSFYAWLVLFGYGGSDFLLQHLKAFVRAVRSSRASQ
jgi:hypothetical protein